MRVCCRRCLYSVCGAVFHGGFRVCSPTVFSQGRRVQKGWKCSCLNVLYNGRFVCRCRTTIVSRGRLFGPYCTLYLASTLWNPVTFGARLVYVISVTTSVARLRLSF